MQRMYTVEVIGFNETERIVLGSIFTLSARRSPTYTPYSCVDPTASAPPDLFLVDAADSASVVDLLRRNGDGKVRTLLIGEEDHNTGWPVLARPLQWARLFVALDAAVANAAVGIPAVPGGAPEQALATGEAALSSPTPAPPQVPAPQYQGERVLVVDDSPTVRQFMKNKLTAMGLAVDVAVSGEQAIGMAASTSYASVFLDVGLPGIDGYQVCRLIKSPRSLARAPVIMLTARSSPMDRWRAARAGCDAYLTKPVEDRRLNAELARVLARHASLGRASREPSIGPSETVMTEEE
jgi:two-component system, cell cycle response regulator